MSRIFSGLLFLPFLILLPNLISGTIPFWFDPARDLLLALDNLKKPTLIGPPTGIPGLFYGPFWIWFLSIPLIFSRNPRLADFIVLMIPYCIFFPLLFHALFKKDRAVTLIMWGFLFLSGTLGSYALFIWNPRLAPLFYLILAFLIIHKRSILTDLAAGLIAGLILNIHISFGIGVFLATTIFLAVSPKRLLPFLAGLLVTFIPTIIFEIRHGFNQTNALVNTLTNGFLYNSAVVGVTGFTKEQIFSYTWSLIPKIFQLPSLLVGIILLAILLKRPRLLANEKRLFLYLTLTLISVLLLYLTSKNPVWDYHFIGVDIVIFLLLTILISKWKLLKIGLGVWVVILAIIFIRKEYFLPKPHPFEFSNLSTKEHIVSTIYQDAQKEKFDISIYDPAIYTYDYDYLLGWIGKDKYDFVPEKDRQEMLTKYLIIPKTLPTTKTDFINYRSPGNIYKTAKTWDIPDGTTIIKRVKK